MKQLRSSPHAARKLCLPHAMGMTKQQANRQYWQRYRERRTVQRRVSMAKTELTRIRNGPIPSGMTEFEWTIVLNYLELFLERLQEKLDRDRTMFWITGHKHELTDMIGVCETVEDAVGKLFLKIKSKGYLEGFGYGLTWW